MTNRNRKTVRVYIYIYYVYSTYTSRYIIDTAIDMKQFRVQGGFGTLDAE